MYVCMYLCMYVCMYVYIYVCILGDFDQTISLHNTILLFRLLTGGWLFTNNGHKSLRKIFLCQSELSFYVMQVYNECIHTASYIVIVQLKNNLHIIIHISVSGCRLAVQ